MHTYKCHVNLSVALDFCSSFKGKNAIFFPHRGPSSQQRRLQRQTDPLAEASGGNSPTYQRFVGALEHVTDVLAQPRLWRLPTDEAKVINMLYSLDKGENTTQALLLGCSLIETDIISTHA